MPESTILEKMTELYGKWKDCVACPLSAKRSQVVFGVGNVVDPKVLIVGEAPGPEEDIRGEPFIGPTGAMFRDNLAKVGIDFYKDCFVTNSVLCFPCIDGRQFRNPLGSEVQTCRPRLMEQVSILSSTVKVILLAGKRAMAPFFYGSNLDAGKLERESEWNRIQITKLTGWREPITPGGPRICVINHPSFILRQGANEASLTFIMWRNQLRDVGKYIHEVQSGEQVKV